MMAPPTKERGSDEFGIEIRFPPHSDAPSAVFRAMFSLIEAFQEIDTLLAESIRSSIRPTMLLEDIEAGSLRVWLHSVLLSVDEESLRSGEYKRIVGSFLVRVRRIMIEWTANKTTITSAAEVEELKQIILDEAEHTNALAIPAYVPIPSIEVARSVALIGEALAPLQESISVRYLSADSSVEINRSFSVAPEVLTDLLVKESLPSQAQMILIVKRPDFLGDSRWEFRHGRQPLEAKMLDREWLTDFHNGKQVLVPGDALKAAVISVARYGHDGELIDTKHEIIKVFEVIRRPNPSQGGLFNR